MKIICVYKGVYNILEIYKIYTSIDVEMPTIIDSNYYCIHELHSKYYPKDCFISLAEFRETRINSILDI